MRRQTMGADYFCDLYARDADPWKFASSDYERHKYEATLNALPMDRYARGLEVGCSIGVFTSMLAPRCESLVAIDPAERALEEARLRCAPPSKYHLCNHAGAWRMAGGHVRPHRSVGGTLFFRQNSDRAACGAHRRVTAKSLACLACALAGRDRLPAQRRRRSHGIRGAHRFFFTNYSSTMG
jgi:hypothetical protein